MASLTIISLVIGTSALAYLLLGPPDRGTNRLRFAIAQATAFIGAGVVFFVANTVLGLLAVLAFRASTGQFISIYVLNDISLLLLSLFQGLVFRTWWKH